MPNDGFVTAVSPGGQKRRVPKHYLDEPFNYKLPPSARGAVTADEAANQTPAKAGKQKEVQG